MKVSVPSSSSAPALAIRCSGEPCSSGAVRIPSRPAGSPGAIANGRQSIMPWTPNITASRATNARLSLNALPSRLRSAARWALGSAGGSGRSRSMPPTMAPDPADATAARAAGRRIPPMDQSLPTVRLKNAWRSSHPWIFQRLVEKPAQRPRPGSIVDVVGVDGAWIGRGFYNGHSRIALRLLEKNPDVAVDAAWFARRIGEAVRLRREILRLDEVSDAWRAVHSEGDGLSGLVVDRYADLLVVEFFSAGMFRHREWIFDALREHFPGCRFHSLADEHVQKQESFDFRGSGPAEPAIITEHGLRFRAAPADAH